MDRILLLSSGMDSFIAWHILGKPTCLHITGHSRYSVKELQTVERLNRTYPEMCLTILELPWLKLFEHQNADIPARNAHFALAAAHYGDTVYLPCQRGEQTIPDRSPEFFKRISELASQLFERRIVVDPVFTTSTKQDMVGMYLRGGYPLKDLLNTMSCFSSEPGRCGRCPACFRTSVALEYNDVLPTGQFKEDIWGWDGIPEYIQRIKDGKYEDMRAAQTKHVLESKGLWR